MIKIQQQTCDTTLYVLSYLFNVLNNNLYHSFKMIITAKHIQTSATTNKISMGSQVAGLADLAQGWSRSY